METIRCKDMRMGMRVILTRPDREYTIGFANPLFDTKWECVGTVDRYSGNSARVCWDNGESNTYKDNELSIYEGRCKSIWE